MLEISNACYNTVQYSMRSMNYFKKILTLRDIWNLAVRKWSDIDCLSMNREIQEHER